MDNINNENLKFEELELYIPIYPFEKEETYDIERIILNLTMIKLPGTDDEIYYDTACYDRSRDFKPLYFFPFYEYSHICNLQFKKVDNIKEFNELFVCKKHKFAYNKFCSKCTNLLCENCEICDFCQNNDDIKIFKNMTNWEQFNINEKKIITLIKKLLAEFYHKYLPKFNDDDFCNIKSEKIFAQKINEISYNNKEYSPQFIDILKLLILDLNSFIISCKKLFSSNKYFCRYHRDNINIFNPISLPEIFELDINSQNFFYYEQYYLYIEKNNSFKSNILSSLNNFIAIENSRKTKEINFYRDNVVKKIIKIENEEYFIIINDNCFKICDYKGNCILRLNHYFIDIVQISKNVFITNIGNNTFNAELIEYNEKNIPIKITDKFLFECVYPISMEFIKNKKILIIFFKEIINFYLITDIDKFEYKIIKEIKIGKDLGIHIPDQYWNKFGCNLIYNEYNSTLLLGNSIYVFEDDDKNIANINFNVMELNNYSVLKNFKINNNMVDFFYCFGFSLTIINENCLMIITNSGMIFIVSLKYYEVITFFNYFDKFSSDEYEMYFRSLFKSIIFNKNDEKYILIYKNYDLKLLKIKDNLEIIELDNCDKFKGLKLQKLKSKKYTLNSIEYLEEINKYVISYTENIVLFQENVCFKHNIEIIDI